MKELLVIGATQYVKVNKERISSSKRSYKLIFHDDNVPFAVGKWCCIV